ncbi:DoxX family protein [Cellulomonas chengniuliangii]|uniref:DoxX family protein n=1 Tax=Cellulomonas chengniuliangii TaxID=2968084 RepID=UPI001D0ECAC2|nr:DoxX family protein [Cellulomonas chengniuliangii]MCC2318699.1 DoxX family protein [Cellulomonas chengniuliangii]
MNVALWIVQILLALLFFSVGAMKVIQPKDRIVKSLAWAADFSPTAIKLIGLVEILGALGLVLPAATGIATILTPLAAVGLAIVMVGAIITHARRGERLMIGGNVGWLLLSLFVAWGRFGPYAL